MTAATTGPSTTMRELAVTVRAGQEVLAGTLTCPDGEAPFPAVLLLPGSGPVDRDSNHRRMKLGITGQLAAALTDAGLVTLRYDKRGVGQSTGDWNATGLFDNVKDAAAALEPLRRRPDVNADKVYLLGHSEGALLATILAARGEAVAGVVLLSASATPGEQLLRWQAGQIAPTLPAPVRAVLRLLRTDLVKQVAKNHARIKATTTDTARIGGVKVNARWTREFMAYDPRPDLARVHVPVLAVTGGKDLQVDPADLERIAAVVPGPVETHLVPDLSHILRPQPGPPSLRAYRKEIKGPVDRRVVDLVVSWLRRR